MEEREAEINTIVNFVQMICRERKIAFVAKDYKGKLIVVAKDMESNKEYALLRNKNNE
jgi:hypothetical protein